MQPYFNAPRIHLSVVFISDSLCLIYLGLCLSLAQLLERDPMKRLGSGARDAAEVKEHPYFQGIDWAALLRKEIDMAYKPQLVHIVILCVRE
jgi:hypothetical protein